MYAQRRVTQFRAVCRHCKRQCKGGWSETEYDAHQQAALTHGWHLVELGGVVGWVCEACLDRPFADVVKGVQCADTTGQENGEGAPQNGQTRSRD